MFYRKQYAPRPDTAADIADRKRRLDEAEAAKLLAREFINMYFGGQPVVVPLAIGATR
jgi:hypothetical protein